MVHATQPQPTLSYEAYNESVSRRLIFKRWYDLKSVIVLSIFISFLSVATVKTMFQLLVYPVQSYKQYGFASVFAPIALTSLLSLFIWVVIKGQYLEKQRYLFGKFAAQNKFSYEASATSLLLPGILFSCGNQVAKRRTRYKLSGSYMGQNIVLGNQHFENFNAGRLNTFDYGFIAVEISRSLPQILLRSRHKGMEFTSGYKMQQVLELEGDFGKYFTLYCPKGYEQDALYVLTPDLMVLLIEYGANFDIEINRNYIYFYHRPFAFDQKQTEELFDIIATLGNAVHSRTKRYRDQLSWIPGVSNRMRRGVLEVVLLNVLIMFLVLLRLLLSAR